ncbi:cell division protein FtsL [Laribacter hongkongensis]|uniref:cell division protein FtsL n=1 Tax=Laribacter hongkongensis TaxID=168471 RepID=UPI001EFE3F2E|nr:cell division protein FtsL [Laribacter hongkongensis]MCG9063946.1 cell division protein FtsL [Laribacter hongkongensis]
MKRLDFVLLAILVGLAMIVITTRHTNRQLYAELEREQKFAQNLDIEFGKLRLEQGTWAAHPRIEQQAGARLSMRVPETQEIQVFTLRGGRP